MKLLRIKKILDASWGFGPVLTVISHFYRLSLKNPALGYHKYFFKIPSYNERLLKSSLKPLYITLLRIWRDDTNTSYPLKYLHKKGNIIILKILLFSFSLLNKNLQ